MLAASSEKNLAPREQRVRGLPRINTGPISTLSLGCGLPLIAEFLSFQHPPLGGRTRALSYHWRAIRRLSAINILFGLPHRATANAAGTWLRIIICHVRKANVRVEYCMFRRLWIINIHIVRWILKHTCLQPRVFSLAHNSMDQKTFEASLKAGQTVRLRWRGQICQATVERVNRSSIAVITKEKMLNELAGDRILVNRVTSGRWSASNCVRPLD